MKRLADWATRPREITEWAQLAVTAVVLIACTLFVFVALHPSKLFLNTLTAGGDMGGLASSRPRLKHAEARLAR